MLGGIQRCLGGIEIGRLGRQRPLRLFAVVVHQLRDRLIDQTMQGAHGLDGARPIVFGFVDTDQRTQGRQGIARIGVLKLLEGRLGTIQHARLEEILRQFMLGMLALGLRQIRAVQEALVHADGALHFAAAAKQAAERKVQLGGFRIEFGDFDKGIDGPVRLLVEQKIQAAEIRVRQRARLAQHLAEIKARRQPAQCKQHWYENQPPGFKVHVSGS